MAAQVGAIGENKAVERAGKTATLDGFGAEESPQKLLTGSAAAEPAEGFRVGLGTPKRPHWLHSGGNTVKV